MQVWATTGDANEYLKETLVRDLFIMSYGTTQSKEKMSLAVKITALWALKVPLEEMFRFSNHSQGSSTHQMCPEACRQPPAPRLRTEVTYATLTEELARDGV